jgi:WD40 repeat protein
VDDLVERQDELIFGGEGSRKRKAIEPTPSVLDGMDDNISSMDLMSEEVLLQIALFIPNLRCLISFCKTSKRMQKLLYTSIHSEKLFRGPFLHTFGQSGMVGNFEMNLSWRERWRMICGLRRGLVHQHSSGILSLNGTSANLPCPRQTIGVLSRAEENSALFYDNPDWNFSGDSSNGYFGMKILRLHPPPNAAIDWQPPVVCYGDFNGIKIFNSVSSMFENQNAQPRFVSLGDDDGGGQVLAIIQCDASQWMNEETNISQPSFFIGFASGRVAAVNATIAECGQKYSFCVSGFNDAHENEVTSLVFVHSITPAGKCGKLLYSACGGGQVYCYPNALCPEHNFSLELSVLSFSSNAPIFSMASTFVHTQNHSFSVICTGDGEGKIRLWTRPDEGLLALTPPEPVPYRRSETNFVPIQVKQAGTRTGLVTRMKFVSNEVLVTCTNNGDLRIWKCCNKPYGHSGGEKGLRPQLELKYDKMGLHNGAVEVVINVGGVLLTSGGNDGKVIGVDLNTGLILGSIDCHTGERLQDREGTTLIAKSCVVDIILSGKEGCMISLCRDGTLAKFHYI